MRSVLADALGKVRRRAPEAGLEIDLRFPSQLRGGQRDVRAPLLGIVLGQGPVDDLRPRAGDGDDPLGELEDGGLHRVAQVDRPMNPSLPIIRISPSTRSST